MEDLKQINGFVFQCQTVRPPAISSKQYILLTKIYSVHPESWNPLWSVGRCVPRHNLLTSN